MPAYPHMEPFVLIICILDHFSEFVNVTISYPFHQELLFMSLSQRFSKLPNIHKSAQVIVWKFSTDFWINNKQRSEMQRCISVKSHDVIHSLGPSDAILRWRSWSTLVQVMACCLTAPSHYLNQCWLIISKVLWHLKLPISKARLKITFSKSHWDLPGANELST